MLKTNSLLILSALLLSCATPTPFNGTINSDENAIIVIDLDASPGSGIHMQVKKPVDSFLNLENYVIRAGSIQTPIVKEVAAGEFTVTRIDNPYLLGFTPNFKKITIEPGTINYLGRVKLGFDYANSQAYAVLLDSEENSILHVKNEFPQMFNLYEYRKNLITNFYEEFGNNSEYEHTDIPLPDEDEAILVVYRPSGHDGTLVISNIYLDNQKIVGLWEKNYTWIRVNPGQHTISKSNERDLIGINLEPGKSYFLRQETNYGRFIRVPIQEAVEDIREFKYREAIAEEI